MDESQVAQPSCGCTFLLAWRWLVTTVGSQSAIFLSLCTAIASETFLRIRLSGANTLRTAARDSCRHYDARSLWGCADAVRWRFHPFFAFDRHSQVQFQASGHWPEGDLHLPLSWRGDLPAGGDFSQATYGEDSWLNVCYSGWGGVASIQRDVMSVTISSQTPWLMLSGCRVNLYLHGAAEPSG